MTRIRPWRATSGRASDVSSASAPDQRRRAAPQSARALALGPLHLSGALALVALIVLAGCAGSPPRAFPVAPIADREVVGIRERSYDLDSDGSSDYTEVLGSDGRVARFRWERSGASLENGAAGSAAPRLTIILDSVPYGMVRDAWEAGRFRAFFPPSRTIAPFPVMTDPALAEFFGVSPCAGVESVYFDGARLETGLGNYVVGENAPWVAKTDFHLSPSVHGFAYILPGDWFRAELREIEDRFARSKSAFTAYCVGTSALGSARGRDGHAEALTWLDRVCQQIIHDAHGRVRITLLSDHGHNLVPSRRIDLATELGRMGYRLGTTLQSPDDVVLPEFGLVSCVALHTHSPRRLAGDCVSLDGVELAAFPEIAEDGTHRIVVLSRDGEATIEKRTQGFAYTMERGDPLELAAIIRDLQSAGSFNSDGSVPDRAFFEATSEAEYPDALDRLWRAFNGLFVHTPDVLLSLEDGVFAGSTELTALLKMQAVHGNLNRRGSSGFIMSMEKQLPPVLRIREARRELWSNGRAAGGN